MTPTVTGDVPPACAGFTLTEVSADSAVLCGGFQPQNGGCVIDAYLMKLSTQNIVRIGMKTLYVHTYLCMYICMYICTYVFMNVCMYVCMYVRISVYLYIRMYVYKYVRTCVYIYVRMCVYKYVYVHVCVFVCMYVCT